MSPSRRSARAYSRTGLAGTRLALAAGLAACVVSFAAGGILLAACDGASGGAAAASASAVDTPTPRPSPAITGGPPPAGAVRAVRRFWQLVGDGRMDEAKRRFVTSDSPLQQWTGEDIAGARFVRVVPGSVGGAPRPGATMEFAAVVWIEPDGGDSPWGGAAEHQLFETVVRMSDGGWRLVDSGTGP